MEALEPRFLLPLSVMDMVHCTSLKNGSSLGEGFLFENELSLGSIGIIRAYCTRWSHQCCRVERSPAAEALSAVEDVSEAVWHITSIRGIHLDDCIEVWEIE